jgi:hypothetical protein
VSLVALLLSILKASFFSIAPPCNSQVKLPAEGRCDSQGKPAFCGDHSTKTENPWGRTWNKETRSGNPKSRTREDSIRPSARSLPESLGERGFAGKLSGLWR